MNKIQAEYIYVGNFGTALAITISWSLHKSVLWAILHGMGSGFYVIYYCCFTR